jgi:hypothetical protein
VKKIQSMAAGLLLLLMVGGCARPTEPSFSPDGSILAFERNGALFLRKGSAERQISPHVDGSLSWAPDGKWLAYTGSGSATILDVASGRAVRSRNLSSPFVWRDDILFGILYDQKTKKTAIAAVDPLSGVPSLQTDISFFPSEMVALPNGEAFMWDGRKAYRFDGLNPVRASQFDGMEVLRSQTDEGSLEFVKHLTKPHGHRDLVQIYKWDFDSQGAPAPTLTIDPRAIVGGASDFAGMIGLTSSVENGRLAATIYAVSYAASDRKRLTALIDRYDLWNMDRAHNPAKLPKADEAFLRAASSRLKATIWCVAGSRSGDWRIISQTTQPRGAAPPDVHIALDHQGTQLAVVTNGKVRVYPLTH